jgi:hypothetical protein
MPGEFNPYREWLGFDGPAPPNHYQLLGLANFEADPERIWAAIHARRALLVGQQYGAYPEAAVRILAEVDAAERCLLNPARKEEYDAHLKSAGPQAPMAAPAGPQTFSTPVDAPVAASAEPPRRQTVWGYDSDAPVAAPAPAPMRPEDFLPPPANAGGYAPAPAPYGSQPPLATPAPMGSGYGAPAAPWPPSQPVDPYLAAPPLAEVPMAPLAQPAWEDDFPLAQPLAAPGYGAPLAAEAPAIPMAAIPAAAPAGHWSNAPVGQAVPAAVPLDDDFGGEFGGPTVMARPKLGSRERPSALLMVGAPLAGIVAIGLLFLFLTDRGPFSSSSGRHVATGPETLDPPKVSHQIEKPHEVNPQPENDPTKNKPIPPPESKKQSTEPMPEMAPEPKVALGPKKEVSSDPPKTETNELIAAALMSARYLAAHRDLAKAKEMIALAQRNDRAGAHSKQISPVVALVHYVDQFWKAVKDQCKDLPAGSSVTIQNITVGVVEAGPDYIILRRAGVNERHVFAEMKSGLAYGLAELYLKKGDAVSHIVLGAFLAVNPTSDRAQARQQWETALGLANDQLKSEIRLLLPELDVKIPEEPPKLPGGANGKEGSPSKQPDDGRHAPPQGEVLAKAQAALEAKYKQQLAAAVFEADKVALAQKLKSDADEQDADPAARFVFLTKASELAGEGGNLKLATDAIDSLELTHAINAIGLKARAIGAVVKAAATPEASKAAAQAALALADEAVLLERYAEAMQLAVHARDAARKSKDNSLLKQCSLRIDEIKALQK